MKNLILALISSLLPFSFAHAEESSKLTVQDLATHLGIKHWKTSVNLTDKFTISIHPIINGKIINKGTILGPSSGHGKDITIMSSLSGDKVKWTITVGHASYTNESTQLKPNKSNFSFTLPKKIKDGTYLLEGYYPEVDGSVSSSGKIEEAKSGFALVIRKKSQ